ncbi:golvesin C-terminal-like domain-containing protein [Streptomyces cinereoruber]|uniref:golvesin C-terminal-like domain-containing protein n=1 Tax=Streptomyces cinereoruber TaxID=67260 RepID=UPI003640D4E4
MATVLAIPLSLPAQGDESKPPKGAAQGWNDAAQKQKAPPLKLSAIPAKDRAGLLGKEYAKSADTAVTTTGDGTGFHLLAGKEKEGYQLRTIASLFEDGFASDTWVGNHCVTGSGKYAAVSYAPRMFTNKPELMVRGAFTAVVDLTLGEITKLPFQSSLAYFSPGCGQGDQAVFTQLTHDGDDKQQTRLITVDAVTGKESKPVTLAGQITSAIPTDEGIVAAHGNKLVRINGTAEKTLASTTAVPFQITADADGGITFIDRELDKKASDKPTAWAKHLDRMKVRQGKKTKPITVASGGLHAWDLTRSARGEVFVTGDATSKALPKRVHNPGRLPKGAAISSHAGAALTTTWSDGKTTLVNPEDAAKPRPARIALRMLDSGKSATLDLRPGAHRVGDEAQGNALSPALPTGGPVDSGPNTSKKSTAGPFTQSVRTQALTAQADNPSEGTGERYCSVARNDVKKQAFQPTPRQVEWAVDQAVVGELNFYRSPNWKNTGTGGYQPQGLFPPTVLAGDPNGTLDNEDPDVTDKWHIPAQVMLGITAQESNMWQATRFAVPGVTANSLIGNYYGVDYSASGEQLDPWRINWADADCGYGITQATDGMRLAGKTKPGETALPTLAQEAVALDYTANIAAGVRILSEKWNQTYNAGMKINGGHPKWIENWFFALWAYNSGFYNTADSHGHWGVGWTNNPANPLWKANRVPFLQNASNPAGDDYSHAAHPQDWPYQEKVIGWAARPISAMFAPGDFQTGYRPAWWTNNLDRSNAKPPVDLFCNASNYCDPSKIGDNDSNDQGMGACTLDSGNSDTNPHWLHCWWHEEITKDQWKDCERLAECGNGVHRFPTSYGEQPDAGSYPPNCATTGLPTNTLVVDDVPDGTTPAGVGANRGCGAVKSSGTFSFTFVPWDTQMDLTQDGVDNPTTVTTYPGKIDTHQIGAGYGNHFWFTHTRTLDPHPAIANRMKVTGTWKLNAPLTNTTRQAKVFVHIPDHGAQTSNAVYRIQTPAGEEEAVISQTANQSNKWVDLGAYDFGNQIPEVQLDNFNGGSGSIDIAFDAVAFVPGTYNGLKMTGNMTANPTAPEPAPVEPGEEISKSFFPVLPGTLASRVDTTTMAPMSNTGSASCAFAGSSIVRKRANSCVHDNFFIVHFKHLPDGTRVPDGEAEFDYSNTIYLDSKSPEFSQVTTIRLKSMDGASNTVNLDYKALCRGSCTITGVDWNGSKIFTKGDLLVRTVTTRFKWTPATETKSTITPYWYFGGTTNGDPIIPPGEVEEAELDIRCDSIGVGTGCVFPKYTPTYVMNSKKFPGAAAHIDMMWRKTNLDWGNKNGGKPLTYLANKLATDDPENPTKTQQKRNRQLICERKWKTYKDTGLFSDMWSLDAGKPITDLKSCDEFAFANALQSAGNVKGPNPVKEDGSECVQTYLRRNPDDTMTLHLRPDAVAPTWKEPCGRSSMSNWQNTQSMQPFGTFINEQRLMEDDNYWMDLDGFTAPTP